MKSSLLETCLDLISSHSPSMKIQIMGRKITENLGYAVFYGEEKRTNFDIPEWEFEPQILSNFPAYDLNFHVK